MSSTLGEKNCNNPLHPEKRQAASQQAATAVFQLPEAPGMQREPNRAAVQACVREQRALSVPEKQPKGDFHPISPSAAAGGRDCLSLWREPREGPRHSSRESSLCYQVLCTVEPHSSSTSLYPAPKTGDTKRQKDKGQ